MYAKWIPAIEIYAHMKEVQVNEMADSTLGLGRTPYPLIGHLHAYGKSPGLNSVQTWNVRQADTDLLQTVTTPTSVLPWSTHEVRLAHVPCLNAALACQDLAVLSRIGEFCNVFKFHCILC